MAMILNPACNHSLENLTEIYNRARKDYMVPMQMTPDQFREYIRLYDVDLQRSFVAVQSGAVQGIGMLGMRPGQAWITRLGVLPAFRKTGIGLAIVRRLVDQADAIGIPRISLEVIEGNRGAEQLFLKFGFRPFRRLHVLGRQHGIPLDDPPAGNIEWMAHDEALEQLDDHPGTLPWKSQARTYRNAGDAEGLRCVVPGKARGWLVFRRQPGLLSDYLFGTEEGDARVVVQAALAHLHRQYPKAAAHVENVRTDDPHLPGLQQAGYEVRFCRTEMERV